MPTMSRDPFGDKWTIASSEEVSSPAHIQKHAGLTEADNQWKRCTVWHGMKDEFIMREVTVNHEPQTAIFLFGSGE
jgi:hypothetical protein